MARPVRTGAHVRSAPAWVAALTAAPAAATAPPAMATARPPSVPSAPSTSNPDGPETRFAWVGVVLASAAIAFAAIVFIALRRCHPPRPGIRRPGR